ncbi:VacB/RNB family exoribonuclease [Chondrus crispus]|uniref:VacB/RNB family exoribonuclease n=1 Tax=Chondrus crispus TaxID=2769 RepID=R7QA44_CHOCR|nr:VacB/RNB family exoribonuclease [Chondrus crispus]CDF34919.1 VacB/RNB family exoribonuclease [Chondrus crispus]|eukprot:XP_005714738.1 VacB/RNB family exoribonuclease [Chondrus crispus]
MPSSRLNVGDIVLFTAIPEVQMSLGVQGRYARVGQVWCSTEDGNDILEVKGWFGTRASLEQIKILHVIWRKGRSKLGVQERTIEGIEKNGLCLASGVRISNHTFMEDGAVTLNRVASRLFSGRATAPSVLFAAAIVLNCDARVTQVDPNPYLNPYEMFYKANEALNADSATTPTQPAVAWYTLAQSVYSGDIEIFSSNVAYDTYMETITCLQNCSFSPHDARGMITYDSDLLSTLEATKHFQEVDRKRLSMSLMNLDITRQFAASICKELGIRDTFDEKVLMAGALCLESEASTQQVEYAETMFFEEDGRADEDAEWRHTFSHHMAYSIHHADRNDRNVAVSIGKFEREGESVGRRHADCEQDYVFVHISDVTRYIGHDLNSLLLSGAMERGRTHFLPTGNMTMLPKAIARMASLAGWRGSCTLTVRFPISNGMINDSDYHICLSRISKPKILSYVEAEEQIQSEEMNDLKRIYNLVNQTFPQAVEEEEYVDYHELNVDAQEHMGISVSPRVRTKRASVLISSMEKAANIACARYAEDRGVPMCFLNQMAPDDVNSVPSFVFCAEILPHHVQDEEACALITSPVHRGPDLINHIQLKAQLRKDAQRRTRRYLTREKIMEEIENNNFTLKYHRGIQMEDRITQYYTHKFLKGQTQKTLVGTMLGYPSDVTDLNPDTTRINDMQASGCRSFQKCLVQLDSSGIRIFVMLPCGIAAGSKLNLSLSWICPDSMRHDAFATQMAMDVTG